MPSRSTSSQDGWEDVSSSSHPLADADGQIQVCPGRRLPGIARYGANFGTFGEVDEVDLAEAPDASKLTTPPFPCG
ncbi:hypothetical protein HT136_24520 [Novosphingobium profundi]|uniref:hypothetical protein n=1 Tax=Novosphingobium profundi TaxID=1774954 RepID=UPI001BD963E9|nr:hypothetical protein [Novosphingobium profundi]MBT0671539.1 hypothetical protein [Novosphingobium profundi]